MGLSKMDIDSSYLRSLSLDWGYGGLLGGGLSYPVTRSTSLALTVAYAFRSIEGDTVGTLSASLTGLF